MGRSGGGGGGGDNAVKSGASEKLWLRWFVRSFVRNICVRVKKKKKQDATKIKGKATAIRNRSHRRNRRETGGMPPPVKEEREAP